MLHAAIELNIRDLFSEDDVDERLDAQAAIDAMPAREAAIVYLFACGHTYDEIGEKVGLTKGRICQILSRIKQNGA